TVEGQVTLDDEAVAVGTHAGGAERHGRVGLDVEEVARANVVVALLVVGVDRAQVDGGVHRRVERVLAGDDLTLEGGEAPPYLGHHQVTDAEGDVRVDRVDRPGSGHVARDLGPGAGNAHLKTSCWLNSQQHTKEVE